MSIVWHQSSALPADMTSSFNVKTKRVSFFLLFSFHVSFFPSFSSSLPSTWYYYLIYDKNAFVYVLFHFILSFFPFHLSFILLFCFKMFFQTTSTLTLFSLIMFALLLMLTYWHPIMYGYINSDTSHSLAHMAINMHTGTMVVWWRDNGVCISLVSSAVPVSVGL